MSEVSEGSLASEKVPILDLLLTKLKKMNTNIKKNDKNVLECVTLDGMMTFGKLENGLHTADFMCCEDVKMEAFIANCKVQAMRDGNVYITELPKRVRNRALFREDNATLSKGQDGRYYFYFSLPPELLNELPQRLVHQAGSIARKVMRQIILGEENK